MINLKRIIQPAKILLALGLLGVLGSCIGYPLPSVTSTWHTVFYRDGDVYVVKGTQTEAYEQLIVSPEGDRKEHWDVGLRPFKIYSRASGYQAIGSYSGVKNWTYFPDESAMIEYEDGVIRNLSTHSSYRVKGSFVGDSSYIFPAYVSPSKFRLTRIESTNQFFRVNAITGETLELTPAAIQFIKYPFYNDKETGYGYFSPDGYSLIRIEHTGNSAITLSAWDIANNKLLYDPKVITLAKEFRQAEVRLCTVVEGDVLVLMTDSRFGSAEDKTPLQLIRMGPNGVSVKILATLDIGEIDGGVIYKAPDSILLFYGDYYPGMSDPERLKLLEQGNHCFLKRYSLSTGECLSIEEINIPFDLSSKTPPPDDWMK